MQITPFFQPIVDIASGRVIGHEVLARFVDSQGKATSAGHLFVDQRISEPELLAYDRSVRMQALQRFAEAGQPGFLTINISPRWIDLLDDDLIPTLQMLELYKVAPEKIVIEIVETRSNPEKLLHIVHRYKALGMRVAVDDFGSGCSQFDRVIQLEPDIVKLDMHLFKQAMQGGFPQDIVRSLSFLAERMGSEILCEGVETFPELRFALEIGSKLVQGYMYSAARQDFTGESQFYPQISRHRQQFLREGIAKEERIIEESRAIHREVKRLCDQVRSTGTLHECELPENRQILSLFICDIEGTQISPTFRVDGPGNWLACNDKQGHNWSWRPYFYQLISGAETMQRLSVTSRSYHDATTGTLVKTIARFIDERRILMVDIREQNGFSHEEMAWEYNMDALQTVAIAGKASTTSEKN